MLNKNNLYRVRLVLSAGNGTQVPKYLDAAASTSGPLNTGTAKKPRIGKSYSNKDGKFTIDGSEVPELEYWQSYAASLEELNKPTPGFEDLQARADKLGASDERNVLINKAKQRISELQGGQGSLSLGSTLDAPNVVLPDPNTVYGNGSAVGIRNDLGRVVKMNRDQYLNHMKSSDSSYDEADFDDDWDSYNNDNINWSSIYADGKGGFTDAFGLYNLENPDDAALKAEKDAAKHTEALDTVTRLGSGAVEVQSDPAGTKGDPVEVPEIKPIDIPVAPPTTGPNPEMGMLPGDDPNGENSAMLKPITIGATTKTSGTDPQQMQLALQLEQTLQLALAPSSGIRIGGLPTAYDNDPAVSGDPTAGGGKGIDWQKASGTASKIGGAMGAASLLLSQSGMGEAGKYAGLAGGIANAASTIMSGQGGAGGAMGAIGGVADMARNTFFSGVHDNDSSLTSGLNSAYDSVSNAAMAFVPVGTIVGGAMKVGGFIGDALSSMGVGTDQMTTQDQILDSSFFKLTPFGLINGIFAKRSDKFSIDKDVRLDMESSYKGSYVKMDDAKSKANKKYGLFSRGALRRANEAIREAKRQQNIVRGINKDAKDMKSIATAMHDTNSLNYKYRLNGGYDQRSMRAAKRGIKIQYFTTETWEPLLEDVFEIKLIDINEVNSFKEGGNINGMINIDTHEIEWEPTLQEFKEGGKTPKEPEIEVIETDTNQKSVIPEGALHKNKHHMEDAEGLTKKGVPVVDNDGDQQAEIELNEIIFTLEVTKELEERYKEFYKEDTSNKRKDELALEAGKLLWHEILYNTEDRTGLINTLKKGGNIPTVTKEFKQGGSLTQDMVDDMVRLALINLLTR